ncbi:hypothetical protein, partial [Rhizobium leguminosarum]|uniref:hypothetical protein n=1 Tax=Rhizobium leguminosarum TaxID=384 RepID=UPI003F99903E
GVKRKHRQAERALITAETVASLAHTLGADRPRSLEADWRVVRGRRAIAPGSPILGRRRQYYDEALGIGLHPDCHRPQGR